MVRGRSELPTPRFSGAQAVSAGIHDHAYRLVRGLLAVARVRSDSRSAVRLAADLAATRRCALPLGDRPSLPSKFLEEDAALNVHADVIPDVTAQTLERLV